jgi:hypothetical protein
MADKAIQLEEVLVKTEGCNGIRAPTAAGTTTSPLS